MRGRDRETRVRVRRQPAANDLRTIMATIKVITDLKDGVLRETGRTTEVAASMDGIMLRSMLFGTLTGGIFGYRATASSYSGSTRKKAGKKEWRRSE